MARAGPAWLLLGVWVAMPVWLSSTKVSLTDRIERLSEAKDLKKLLRTRNNLLVLYSKAEAAPDSLLSLLSTVAQAVKGQGTICWVDCSDAESRKLCKKMKIDPSSKDKKVELLHYLDGVFHMDYNRPMTLKSMVAFMKDPKGPPLWEEDPGAKDVVHIDSEKGFRRLLKKEEKPLLVMFYAPWCPKCKRMKLPFQQAATLTRGRYVLAGMNVYPSEFENIKEEYGVRGYPTFCYFEKGRFLFYYDHQASSAEDIVEWLKSPQPPPPPVPELPWAEEGGSVYHLTDDDFDRFVKEHSSVLVMFHAPWCGHCKSMKPEFESAAKVLHEADGADLSTRRPTRAWQKGSTSPSTQLSSTLRMERKCLCPRSGPRRILSTGCTRCPHCKKVIPIFTATAEGFRDDRKIACAAVDCVQGRNQELCQQEAIRGYPTFHHYHYGKLAEKYDGERTELGFTSFIRSLREGDHERLGRKKEEL
ncbi:protein disulfide-isomerase A5 isoform X4 [Sorex araneus]|uniref:protein disulfide-isomerase A5 isoform X4 n=1 Tax=Sorex araneus TaxID=42254 RepID=UPI002433B7AE|nr:protein disulfide-isomerase A5 isoform X4 [Sorex araneus]